MVYDRMVVSTNEWGVENQTVDDGEGSHNNQVRKEMKE